MNSAIYSGTVWHQRLSPKAHAFKYRVFMMYLDLAELDQVFLSNALWSCKKFAPARFKRSDFLGDAKHSLEDTVRERVALETGKRPCGPIRLLANIRYWGFIINPISCYYCFDSTGTRLEAMLIDVTNTPWKECQQYVLSCDSDVKKQTISFNKTMHVSPFMPMDMEYQWTGSAPDDQLAFTLSSFISNTNELSSDTDFNSDKKKVFSAGVTLKREEINTSSLTLILLRFPLMTFKVFTGIHWQALKLWLKGLTVFKHPSRRV